MTRRMGAVKTDPADAKPSGAAKPGGPAKTGSAMTNTAKTGSAKTGSAMTNAAKTGSAKANTAKTGSVKANTAKTGSAKADTAKTGGSPPQAASTTATATGGAAAAVVRWVLLLLIGALGVVVGVVGSFAHRATATAAGVAWPTGLFFAFCGLFGLLLGLGELFGVGPARSWRPSRLSAVSVASAGWLIALLWLSYFGPPPTGARKGDVILANDWRSLAFLFGGMVLATTAVYRAWVANLAARLEAHSKG